MRLPGYGSLRRGCGGVRSVTCLQRLATYERSDLGARLMSLATGRSARLSTPFWNGMPRRDSRFRLGAEAAPQGEPHRASGTRRVLWTQDGGELAPLHRVHNRPLCEPSPVAGSSPGCASLPKILSSPDESYRRLRSQQAGSPATSVQPLRTLGVRTTSRFARSPKTRGPAAPLPLPALSNSHKDAEFNAGLSPDPASVGTSPDQDLHRPPNRRRHLAPEAPRQSCQA